MKIQTIRIHTNGTDEDCKLFDRNGNFEKTINHPISIYNLKVKRFGFCNWDTIDVTLELEEPIEETDIKETPI